MIVFRRLSRGIASLWHLGQAYPHIALGIGLVSLMIYPILKPLTVAIAVITIISAAVALFRAQ